MSGARSRFGAPDYLSDLPGRRATAGRIGAPRSLLALGAACAGRLGDGLGGGLVGVLRLLFGALLFEALRRRLLVLTHGCLPPQFNSCVVSRVLKLRTAHILGP